MADSSKIRKLEYTPASFSNPLSDLTVWFEDTDEPYSWAEFKEGSSIREELEFIQTLLDRVLNA